MAATSDHPPYKATTTSPGNYGTTTKIKTEAALTSTEMNKRIKTIGNPHHNSQTSQEARTVAKTMAVTDGPNKTMRKTEMGVEMAKANRTINLAKTQTSIRRDKIRRQARTRRKISATAGVK